MQNITENHLWLAFWGCVAIWLTFKGIAKVVRAAKNQPDEEEKPAIKINIKGDK